MKETGADSGGRQLCSLASLGNQVLLESRTPQGLVSAS